MFRNPSSRENEIKELLQEEQKGKQRRISHFVLVIIIVAIIAAVLVLLFLLVGTSSASCQNFECLEKAAQSCSQKTLVKDIQSSMLGVDIISTTYYEITKDCQLYLRVENEAVAFTEKLMEQMRSGGKTSEEIRQVEQQVNEDAGSVIGRQTVCTFKNKADLLDLIRQWKNGDFSSSYLCNFMSSQITCTKSGNWHAQCTGNLLESDISI